MEPYSQKYNDGDKLIEKIVATKVKTSLQPFGNSRNIDNCCLKKNRPSYTTFSNP